MTEAHTAADLRGDGKRWPRSLSRAETGDLGGLRRRAGSLRPARLLEAFPGLRMVATDYDAGMAARARRALAPFGDRASVQRADAAGLPFEDGRFHLVLSAAMLHHVGAWEKALAEALRVLRPGGVLIGYDLVDAAPARLRFGPGHGTRMLRPGQLEAELHRLHAVGIRVRPAVGNLAVRFAASKAA